LCIQAIAVDNVDREEWAQRPWPHDTLAAVEEVHEGALNRVFRKARATAEAGNRVVVLVATKYCKWKDLCEEGARILFEVPAGAL